ncbi:CUB and sushi domain-containing protein 3-like [Ruditapes philippinarum]|uniref:CUB and sushi domain-containing protein 3-like n=1 Tax=Ruditapes philippinarum TaxID=129788 RepID=UPI00295A81C2|nr:CUB and sushi domain-containing protein 3-like [Ruditapes philippinarum]
MRLKYQLFLSCALFEIFALSGAACPDVRTCYNCEVIGSCVMIESTGFLLTEEQCMQRLLLYSVVWSVEYTSLTGTCYQNSCDDQVVYKKGSVVHRKTCDTVCEDFTLSSGYRVNSSIPYDSYYTGVDVQTCLSGCLTTNTSCAVLYEPGTMECWVYTNCLDSCSIEHAQGWNVDVYLRQCEPEGTSNVALNKSTSMSTLWTAWGDAFTFRSPLGVDGDTTQDKYANSCFVTDWEIGPWWKVDLGAMYRINRVVLYNRLDSNIDRAHDIVLSMGLTESSLAVYDYIPYMYSTYPFTFRCGTTARFVQLQINASYGDHFHLCEVQVFGISDCGSLTNPLNGLVHTNETTLNNDAVYNCNTGFILTGSVPRTCQTDGIWSGNAPTCEPVNCSDLVSPANGSVTLSGLTYMNTARYNCSIGFVLTGSSTRTCMSDGNWDNSPPSCIIVDCGPISNPENGSVLVPSSTFASVATYTCLNGYFLTGSATRLCTSDGYWNGSAPSCTYIACGVLLNPSNGSVSISSYGFMGTATYSCLTGFNLSGSIERTCLSDGNWNASEPSCYIIDCGILQDPSNGSVTLSGSTFLSTASYSFVLTGIQPVLGPVRKNMFFLDGNWKWFCPIVRLWLTVVASVDPANGIVSVSGFTYLSTATYSCFVGYNLTVSETRVCMSDGNWNGSAPFCLSSLSVTTSTTTPSPTVPPSNLSRIYIMACICYPNKTFIGLTQKEIIQHLIEDTKIDTKNTSRSKSKLVCRDDSRQSSMIMGSVGASVLSTALGVIICSDLITLLFKLKKVKIASNKLAANDGKLSSTDSALEDGWR